MSEAAEWDEIVRSADSMGDAMLARREGKVGGWLKERVHLEILDRDGKILAVILSLGKGGGPSDPR